MNCLKICSCFFLLLAGSLFAQDDFFVERSFQEQVFQEQSFQEDFFEEEIFEEETFKESSFRESAFVEQIEFASGLDIHDERVEVLNSEDMEARYGNEFGIDWGYVASRFAVGTSVIVLTGVVGGLSAAFGNEPVSIIAFASFKSSVEGAVSGVAIGSAVGLLRGYAEAGNLSAAKKYMVEDAADGYMWGAIFGAVSGAGIKLLSFTPYEKFLCDFPSAKKIFGQEKNLKLVQRVEKLESLPKNAVYKSNGYVYQTDAAGRIQRFGGRLKLKAGERNPAVQRRVGYQMDCGAGGHLIANRFGGSGFAENMVAMAERVNNSAYKKLENHFASILKDGKNLSVFGEIKYSGNSPVPAEFIIKYVVDGVLYRVNPIKNVGCFAK